MYREVDKLERERGAIQRQIARWEKEDKAALALANITDAQVRTMLTRMADEMPTYPREQVARLPVSILDRIELDPDEATLQLCYRIPLRSG